jgi:hypothetical protein
MLRSTIRRKPALPDRTPAAPPAAFASRPWAPPQGHAAEHPLPPPVRERMESALGRDFTTVRIHPRDASAPRLGALAYTRGEHLHFAPGVYRPGSAAGESVLRHELAHVVQQRQGRVRPTRAGPVPLNDSPVLEREADLFAARTPFAGAPLSAPTPAASTAATAAGAAVQLLPWWKKAAYGLGAAVGGAALVGGAIAASPLVALGGAAALGGSALLARRDLSAEAKEKAAALKKEREAREPGYEKRLEKANELRADLKAKKGTKLAKSGNKRTQADLESLHKLRKDLAFTGENPLLHKVLTETLGQANLKDTSIRGGSGTSHGETQRDDYGGHVARLDDLETNTTRRQSYLVHELTHVAADRKYTLNRVEGQQFANYPYVGASDKAAGEFVAKRRQQIEEAVGTAKDTAFKDTSLKQSEREYIHDRLHYTSKMPGVEYDTVANELLLYAHQKKLPKDSPTVKQIHGLAADAYRRRNGPYAATGKL